MTIGVSIIVLCYNAAKWLPKTLARIAPQNFFRNFQWEVVGIDNVSTDTTGEAAFFSSPTTASAPLRSYESFGWESGLRGCEI